MPSPPFTLSQLMTPQTLADVEIKFLALLQAGGFPAITEWAGEPTGTEMTFVDMLARTIEQMTGAGAPVDQQIASVAAGRFLAWAKGGWMDLEAEQVYLLKRQQPTRTTFDMTLTSVSTAPAYEFEVGDVWLAGASGRRYQSTTGGSLPPGGSLQMSFQAEATGSAYADLIGGLVLVTVPAGVTLVAGVGEYSAVDHLGSSTGTLAPSRTNPSTPPDPHVFSVRIVASGDVDAATFELGIDGGSFTFMGPVLPFNDLGGGTSVAATDGGVSPSFVAGDVFSFQTPGGANRVQGDDEETDERLAQRCRDRWPSQSRNVLDGKVRIWVNAAYPSVNRVRTRPDTLTPGRFVATVADSHGTLDATALQKIEQYVRPRLNTGEGMDAISALPAFVYATGRVLMPSSMSPEEVDQVKIDVDTEWQKYLASIEIGPSEVVLARLVALLIDAGAVDVSGLVFSALGAIWPLNVDVPDGFVPIAKPLISLTLSWGYA